MSTPITARDIRFRVRESCPICGPGHGFRTLCSRPYDSGAIWDFLRAYYPPLGGEPEWLDGARYELRICMTCELTWQLHCPTGELARRLYDAWLDRGDARAEPYFRYALANPTRTKEAQELRLVAAALGRRVPDVSVFDYGTGWGLYCIIATRLGAKAFGTDLADARRAFMREHGVEVLDVDGVPPRPVEYVALEQVLEHVPDPLETLKRLSETMAPGGIMKVSVPRAADIEARIADVDWSKPLPFVGRLNAVGPLEHVNCFGDESLRVLATCVGLRATSPPWSAEIAALADVAALPRHPTAFAKAVVRPFQRRWSRSNTYAWFVKG